MFKKWCLKKNGGGRGKGLKVECHVSLRFCPLKYLLEVSNNFKCHRSLVEFTSLLNLPKHFHYFLRGLPFYDADMIKRNLLKHEDKLTFSR